MTTATADALAYCDIGDQPKVQTVFRDDDGIPLWPLATTSKYRRPDGTVGSITPTQVTVATWTPTGETNVKAMQAILPVIDQAGVWEWWQTATSGVAETDQGLILASYGPGT